MKNQDTRHGEGFVYIFNAQGTDRYKIGISLTPQLRLKGIQTGCAFKVYPVHYARCLDMHLVEKTLHERFAKYRVIGEWFSLDKRHVIDGIEILKLVESDYHSQKSELDSIHHQLTTYQLKEVEGDLITQTNLEKALEEGTTCPNCGGYCNTYKVKRPNKSGKVTVNCKNIACNEETGKKTFQWKVIK